MRTENSMKNIYISIITQIIITVLGFVSRKVFINNLGTEYLGVNGLLRWNRCSYSIWFI